MKIIETVKSIALVLLIISAGYLTWRTWVYNDSLLDEPYLSMLKPSVEYAVSDGMVPREAVWPVKVAVIGPDARFGAQYSADVRQAYGRLREPLSEALGTSYAPRPAAPEEWRGVLTGESVYIGFSLDVPLAALTRWLDAEPPDYMRGVTVSELALAADSEKKKAFLYYRSGNDYYVCGSELQYEALPGPEDGFGEAECRFAFEEPELYPRLDPDSMTLPAPPPRPEVEVSCPAAGDEAVAALLAALRLSPYTNFRYEELGGTVFVDNQRTFRLSNDTGVYSDAGLGPLESVPLAEGPGDGIETTRSISGGLYLDKGSSPDEPGLRVEGSGDGVSLDEAIEAARSIVEESVLIFSGEAEVCLSQCGYDRESDTYYISFDYRIAGTPLYMPSGNAAFFTIESGVVTEIRFNFRSCAPLDGQPVEMPMRQALAALGGGMPELAYLYDGGKTARAVWAEAVDDPPETGEVTAAP